MARPRKDATTASNVAVSESTVTADIVAAGENMSADVKIEDVDDVVIENTISKKETPLRASDEIKVVSLVPNVMYKDGYTNDYYEWTEAGQEEWLTFETLERMWRNSKGYFRNMWLRPEDNRVMKKFGLEGMYKKYDFLMDGSNYTDDNIEEVYNNLSTANKELKFSLCNKIKNMVAEGELTDIRIIKNLESHLQIDLTSFI